MTIPRAFAYVGIAAVHLFIAEVVLAAFLITRPSASVGRFLSWLNRCDALGAAAWVLLLFCSYGLMEAWLGLAAGNPAVPVLQSLVIQSYPFFLFVGIFAAGRKEDFFRRYLPRIAWVHGLYGVAFATWLWKVDVMMPGAHDVRLFAQPGGSAILILALLVYGAGLRQVMIPLALNVFVLLANQVRAEFLALVVGAAIFMLIDRRRGKLLVIAGLVTGLFTLGHVTRFAVKSNRGDISTRSISARVITAIDPDKASQLDRMAYSTAGTISWRTEWWRAIWHDVHGSRTTAALGLGYGFPLYELVPYIRNDVIRTPHSVFFYTLGYMGWIGVILFYLFQVCLLLALWSAYVRTGETFGLIACMMYLAQAHFSNFFETPYGAVPYYIVAGCALAPLAAGNMPRLHARLDTRAALTPA